MKDKLKCELKLITPEMARRILEENNTRNRPLARPYAEKLAEQMRQGQWMQNGDTIRMSGDVLLDGQHRLTAIVLSGVAVECLVVSNLSPDVFPSIDINKHRSMGDCLAIKGFSNSVRLAAALILVDKYYTGRVDRSVDYSNTDIERLVLQYPGVKDALQTGIKTKLIVGSVLDACHYLFSQVNPALANEFVDKVVHGAGLVDGSPWLLLRERLVSNTLSKAKLGRPYIMALCIKAFNCALKGRRLVSLRWREGEEFPVIGR